MFRSPPVSLFPLVLSVVLATPLAAQTPVVRGVTLSTAGLALIESDVTLAEGPLRFSVPRSAINDVLKSLLIADPAGAVAVLTMDGPNAFDDAFAALPLDPDAVGDPVQLLRAMTGAPLRVTRRGEVLAGTLMGVSERQGENGRYPVVNLSTSDGLRSLPLDEAATVALDDPADRDVLASALAAWAAGRSPNRVALTLTTDVSATRDASLVWVQAAPVWRTAWRAIDTGDGALQLSGWAVVENATGQTWDSVTLTLATGAIRAIEARLYERELAPRDSDRRFEPAPVMAAAPMLRAEALSMPMPAPAPVPVTADDGDSFSRFTLTTPVTLAAGQMASLPFLSETLADARLTHYRGGSGARHPDIALRIENPLPLRLPAGVLTLYEQGRGHAGDAMIPELPPGAEEIVTFARDTAVELREDHGVTETLREMRLIAGVLEVVEDLQRTVTYRIAGAPQGDRQLTLDHPRRDGWTVTTQGGEERLDAWRWRLDIPAAGSVRFDVIERQPRLRRVVVSDIDLPTLAAWQGRSPDPALAARLGQIRELREGIAGAERQEQGLAAEIAELEREQQRLVSLIVQLGDGPANADRRARVDAIDTEIAARAEGIARARAQAEALRADLAAALAR